ncbi:DNA mismatch repair protein MutS [Lottiidibacillus patelloidae]|uniref:DNA mismatch repair protein MutS n=1 Tax=Lottiidibacillus patelloidae TaxID=2670334 RepID=A0A263BY61_9BACI|nr:DNA mismatch repair protein MutS [Lottiidibacillus patelloidae]OZM58654.1 DNA mismatch repair protein MutS [Lottiidibacillus patelloidae]
MSEYTPMIKQYLAIKAQYKDAFLFFRLGDFYEMFFEDAVTASQELEITLTSRDGGQIPMCGVPHHSAEGYINRLIEKGYKVALCEQVEDPKHAKGVVKREVVQLITPGTVMNGSIVSEKENNYLAAITCFSDGTFGLALCDLTTGENKVTLLQEGKDELIHELFSSGAKEVVVASNVDESLLQAIQERLEVTVSREDESFIPDEFTTLVENIEQPKLIESFARLLQYMIRTQKRSLDHLQPVFYFEVNEFMKIDMHSKRNLELVESNRNKSRKGSLLWLLDKTVTAMGGRMLKQWIERPLITKEKIETRQQMVETFVQQFFERENLREQLKGVYDLERLAGRVAFGNVNARDLIQLKKSLQQVPEIISTLQQLDNPYSSELAEKMDPCERLTAMLEKSIQPSPPLSIKDGDIINDGYNEQLDRYRDATRNGKAWIAQLQQQEREETGIKSLKIGYNKVFGYYIEVTKANLHLLPEGKYERKQTLTNAERYITPELKEKESLILDAEEKIVQLEYELFIALREEVKTYIPVMQKLARQISEIDCLQSFATISENYHYVKPTFSENRNVLIKEGRHPVVEKMMNSQEYVANDVELNASRETLLITGPNMSGKSTYMRQVALTAIMAQIGCFIPADSAELPIFDKVFTRIGAADDLAAGQSTFMVEMLETKLALAKATQNSLILLDEIGRGTSTYDGMALAQAIIEYISEEIKAKTMFSTHYHELTDLEDELEALHNVHVSAIEENGKVVFLHKVRDGRADESYGIHVAQLAELPDKLIVRAREILAKLESGQSKNKPTTSKVNQKTEEEQLSLFVAENNNVTPPIGSKEQKVLKQLQEMNMLEMTPLEAMNKLYDLQKKLKA